MFLVFNKDKTISYVVTVFTVGVLFLAASVFGNTKETVQTATNESINYEKINNNVDDKNIIENIN